MTIVITPGQLFLNSDTLVPDDIRNDGVLYSLGTVTFAGTITGSGRLELDPSSTNQIAFEAPVSAGQTIDLPNGTTTIGDLADFDAQFLAPLPVTGTLVFPNLDAADTSFAWNNTTDSFVITHDGITNAITVNSTASYVLVQPTADPDGSGDAAMDYAMLSSIQLECFLQGTRLRTPDGEIAVEDIRVGDLLQTSAGRPGAVTWVGRTVLPDAAASEMPVTVKAGAFGPGLPARDLHLSEDHALLIDGALIPVKYLIDGTAILRAPTATAPVYYHVALEQHGIIYAEGLPAESYLRTTDEAADAPLTLRQPGSPGFIQRHREAHAYAPYIVAGPALEAARQRLKAVSAQGVGAADRRAAKG
jgi:hypothetical protein